MTKKKRTKFQTARNWLLFWTLFIGIGAVAGASGMLLDPSGKAMGMDAMLPYFQVLPLADKLFQNFIFSGIALLIVNVPEDGVYTILVEARRARGSIQIYAEGTP